MHTTKAYAYLRVSDRSQTDGHGFDRQEETIRAFAHLRSIEIVRVYRDALTGTEADRPAFLEMLTALLSNGVRTVVVERLDRVARDVAVQSTLLSRLVTAGATLYAADTGRDITAEFAADPMQRALVQMQGVFAELDKGMLVLKLRKAREAKRERNGKCEGRKAFGEKPGEGEVLERILSMRRATRGRERMSFEAIAAELNRAGVVTRSGKPWAPATVYGIVRRAAPRLASARG